MRDDLQRWSASLTAFCEWLAKIDEKAATLWSDRLRANDLQESEGAIAEAVAWDYFAHRADPVGLMDKPGTGGVDFCFAVNTERFLLEVTNISTDTATANCGMPDSLMHKGNYGLLTKQVRACVRRKIDQAIRSHTESSLPLLVAVTTLHSSASVHCMRRHAVEFAMSSDPKITWRVNVEIGESDGAVYQSTDLKRSVFLSPTPILGPGGEPIAQARFEPISGFVLCGFGVNPSYVRPYGGLNPAAALPFEPRLLSDIPFCSFARWPVSDGIEFDWTITDEQEQSEIAWQAEKRLRQAGRGALVDQMHDEARRRAALG